MNVGAVLALAPRYIAAAFPLRRVSFTAMKSGMLAKKKTGTMMKIHVKLLVNILPRKVVKIPAVMDPMTCDTVLIML